MVAYIVGACEFYPRWFAPGSGDLVIAADGGYNHLDAIGVTPDVIVGDFDSSPYPKNTTATIMEHNPVKDKTDMALAVDYAFSRGCRRFMLYGASGGRLDHTFANLALLSGIAERGGIPFLFGEDNTATAIRSARLEFSVGYQGTVSAFAFGAPVRGVTIEGLKYPLSNHTLTPSVPLGVSNEFLGKHSTISCGREVLLVIWQNNLDKPLPVCYTIF